MAGNSDLHGVYVPLITPFTADDKPALGEIERLANESLDAGATGLVALGTTGEPATLTADEKSSVVDVVASVCKSRSAQLLVGAGTNSTAVSLEAVRWFGSRSGVTGLLSVVPYYTRPSEAGIVAHFKELAKESPVPLVVYNIPYRTGRGLGAKSLLELANTPNIAGLKQAVGGIDADTMTLMANVPSDFNVLCGDDAFIFPLMSLGGRGAIAASSHVCTKGFVSLVNASLKGDVEKARQISNKLLPVCQLLFEEPSPGVIKGVLAAQGRISTANLRAPMTKASEAAASAALAAVEKAESQL